MTLKTLLDVIGERILQGEGADAIAVLCDTLREDLLGLPQAAWLEHVVRPCRAHPIHQLLLQDPYTARAFFKPRGYAGDAEMLDFIYSGSPPEGTSSIGRAVFQGTTRSPNGLSVLFRRDLLARRIDDIALAFPRPRILALACGHLREAQISDAVIAGRVGEFVALDQDSTSLAVVQQEQAVHGIQVIHSPITALTRNQISFRDLHFVYAAGLFDYLPTALAKQLLHVMFESLVPGGQLLIANFAPDNHGRGYMECFMDWRLLYRDEAATQELADAIPEEQVAERLLYRDELRNVVYLELVRAAGCD